MGYLHKVVINNVCEIVCGKPVGLDEDLVLQFAVIDGDSPVYGILEACAPGVGHFLADDERNAFGKLPVYFFIGKAHAVPVIFVLFFLLLAISLQRGQPFL